MINTRGLVAYLSSEHKQPSSPIPPEHKKTLSQAGYKKAYTTISQWEGYKQTPLRNLDKLASSLNVSSIGYKDESSRFGLGSFKALGGAYAVNNLLVNLLEKAGLGQDITTKDILLGKYRDFIKTVTVTCATDGNHGKSVAWGSKLLGCNCVIYIHSKVSKEREEAISNYGARVVRTKGNYDDSVAQASKESKEKGYYVVSDTSYPGYTDIPKDVMQGYTVMVQEALDQFGGIPTHIFIQGGVGGLAAAVTAHVWGTFSEESPIITVVEPELAACIYESAKQGKLVAIQGELATIMAGLACGEVSVLAWPILKDGVDSYMVITDESVRVAMRRCADGSFGNTFVAGESGVAGLVGLEIAAKNKEVRQSLALDENSRILLFGTEGATAPNIYQEIVGIPASKVKCS